jgi:hypothetical protein
MWHFNASMLLLDVLCYAAAGAVLFGAFRALDYAEDRGRRQIVD